MATETPAPTPTSISTHISAALGVIIAAIAALHPDFHIAAALQQDIVVVATAGAILLEGQHGWLKSKALQYAHEADMFAKRVGVTPAEVLSAARVVESKLKPADAQLVNDIMSGAKSVVDDPTQPPSVTIVKPAPGPAPIEGATLPQA